MLQVCKGSAGFRGRISALPSQQLFVFVPKLKSEYLLSGLVAPTDTDITGTSDAIMHSKNIFWKLKEAKQVSQFETKHNGIWTRILLRGIWSNTPTPVAAWTISCTHCTWCQQYVSVISRRTIRCQLLKSRYFLPVGKVILVKRVKHVDGSWYNMSLLVVLVLNNAVVVRTEQM